MKKVSTPSDNFTTYNTLLNILFNKNSIGVDEFSQITQEDFDIGYEIALALGIPLEIRDSRIILDLKRDIFQNTFCIVDIETTGFSPIKNHIIEIGAIKYQNGKILDRFECYVFAKNIPSKITEITGISDDMLLNAKKPKIVLEEFKLFLQNSIFVAHNVDFDFNFINGKLLQHKIPPMKNIKLCTLNLARKTINANKYGLEYLNQFLNINHPIRHRAYADCIIALKVFEHSLLNLPSEIENIKDLLIFTKAIKI